MQAFLGERLAGAPPDSHHRSHWKGQPGLMTIPVRWATAGIMMAAAAVATNAAGLYPPSSRGIPVAIVHATLTNLGYRTRGVEGRLGPRRPAAVVRFHSTHGREQDAQGGGRFTPLSGALAPRACRWGMRGQPCRRSSATSPNSDTTPGPRTEFLTRDR